MRSSIHRTLALVALLVSPTIFAAAPDSISFNRDIRPILSDACFQCHGPDRVTRKADLRLDLEKEAFADRDGHAAVVRGDLSRSELIARITHPDPEERMPPTDSGRSLTPHQIDLLKRWVEQGATWQAHWSFIPPQRPELPEVKHKDWPANPIDWFILSQLESKGLSPSPPAEKTALLRRVTFDLTGLPPTLAELDAFLADNSPHAYEQVVDRLLSSPRYAERMAAEWLDAARYADSHGYSLDRRRVMWPWRDWVIQAYQQNLPFDQFTLHQLAGDLLPHGTLAQQVATGFNRNHPIQSEGGVINEEYRVETVVDRVETTSAVFLGLTLGCARCHDHKYEPISQKEFYAFYAFFNNVPESAHVGNADKEADKPFINAPSPFMEDQLAAYQREIVALEKQIAIEQPTALCQIEERVWIDDDIPSGAEAVGNGDGAQTFEFVSSPAHPVYSGKRSSIRTSQERGQHLIQNANPGFKVGSNAKLFSYVYLDPVNPPDEIMLQWHDGGGWGHRAYWGENRIPWGKESSPERKSMGPLPQAGRWVRLEVNAEDVGLAPDKTLTGWAFTQFGGTVYWDKAGISSSKPTPAQARLAELKAAESSITKSAPTVMVMAEMNPPRKTFILNRGQYDRPSEVETLPGLPVALGQLPEGLPPNRLALARWLVSPSNPLTARVTVNRFWQMYFGTGIVKTAEDFGAQGERPTHPQLLDWLATEFVRTGWDVKAMQKLIVTSATYQQASKVTAELLERDPHNRWLARGPRFRLPAEMIRDHALATSGLLVEQQGGESVRPYQPPGLWDDVVYSNVPRFVQDHGDKLYRRSLYTYWKRSVPPPSLQAFDAPSREACVLSRSRSNTPLAALVLMNDPTFVEAARKLAERILREGGPTGQTRLDFAFRLVTSRHPRPHEMSLLTQSLAAFREEYRDKPAAAEQLMKVGESPYDDSLNVTDLAAYTAIANALLSSDESITK